MCQQSLKLEIWDSGLVKRYARPGGLGRLGCELCLSEALLEIDPCREKCHHDVGLACWRLLPGVCRFKRQILAPLLFQVLRSTFSGSLEPFLLYGLNDTVQYAQSSGIGKIEIPLHWSVSMV